MKKNTKTHRVSVKLSNDYYNRFNIIADGRNASETFRAMIDGAYYLNKPELAPICMGLMDSMNDLKEECSEELYYRVEKGVTEICQLLSIR